MEEDHKTALPFEPNLDAIAQWLADLPSTSERERYVLLFSGLQALNEAGLEPSFHFQSLEKIRTPVIQATRFLAPLFLGKPLPLEPGIRKLAKLSAQFQAELARGYDGLIHGGRFDKAFSKDEQGRIIYCALSAYNEMFLHLALMYEAAPSAAWQRVNEMYRLAESLGLSGWAAKHAELANASPCSVQELFLRLQTFRLLAPYRLAQDEIQRVFETLRQHGGLLQCGRALGDEGKRADFSVDLSSQALPCSLLDGDGPGGEGIDLRYLFLQPFRKLVGVLASPSLNKESGYTEQLSSYLQVRLGGSLVPLPGKKGVSATVLAGYKSLVEAMTRPEDKASFDLQELEDHILPFSKIDASKTSGTFSPSAAVQKASAPQIPIMAGAQPKQSAGVLCRVYPADVPGFYLVEGVRLKLRGGILMGVFTDDKLNQFGLVCPGREEVAGLKYYGFELLATGVSLVRAVFDSNSRKRHRCFFSRISRGRYSLITPPTRLRGGDSIVVIGPDRKEEKYRVVKMLERTAEFCQFEIASEKVGARLTTTASA